MAQADNPTDIILVLGSRTNEDGSPTEMMKSRIKRAAELYTSFKQQNINCRVIVTGYQAPDQVTDNCPRVTRAQHFKGLGINGFGLKKHMDCGFLGYTEQIRELHILYVIYNFIT